MMGLEVGGHDFGHEEMIVWYLTVPMRSHDSYTVTAFGLAQYKLSKIVWFWSTLLKSKSMDSPQ